jgi:hypothetical protein
MTDNVALSVVFKKPWNPVRRGVFGADFLRLPARRRCCGPSSGSTVVANNHLTSNRAPVSDYRPLYSTIPGLAQDARGPSCPPIVPCRKIGDFGHIGRTEVFLARVTGNASQAPKPLVFWVARKNRPAAIHGGRQSFKDGQ